MFRTLPAVFATFLIAPSLAFATPRTDIVFLTNGDRVTGEIIRLEAGILEFKTDTMGTTFIEWRFIADIISQSSQSVETIDGDRILGQLQKPEEGDRIIVATGEGSVSLASDEVVSVWPVQAGFWQRMDLDASLGFDYAKSTDIANLTLAVDFQHLGNERLTESSLRGNVTTQEEGNDLHRYELRAAHQYLRPAQQFRAWLGGMESNDALGVDLRLTGGGGIGKYFVKTNNTWFSLSAGLLATQERPRDGDTETNVESVFSMRYRYFKFADPERNFDTTLSLFPSLTDFGRMRADLRSTFKLEFFRDLIWSLELYATHDSDPLSEDAEKTDYGIASLLGWSY